MLLEVVNVIDFFYGEVQPGFNDLEKYRCCQAFMGLSKVHVELTVSGLFINKA